ncbi:MerR family transcriptional regulator [Bosea massiliensis]|uniref:MerR family transcriptional regulator n=1 Tax=Bosea massiliensis TaxID=151419 RepID=A0ABW0PBZ2_9HYPH
MKTYSIREIADEFGISLRTVRFYEQRGLLEPSRGAKYPTAPRIYSESDRVRLAEIIKLTKMGFSLAEIARGNITDEQYREQLTLCRDRLAELETAIGLIEARLSQSAEAERPAQPRGQ